jgi:hypothetical protein
MYNQTDAADYQNSTVEFAPWPTEVQNDDLAFVGIRYGGYTQVSHPEDEFGSELTLDYAPQDCCLEATFISREKKTGVVFSFDGVSAFRVLDEHGLTELWVASGRNARPASTTFKVKGHGWQRESELCWIVGGCDFSYMVATSCDGLEVVTDREPTISYVPAVVWKRAVK